MPDLGQLTVDRNGDQAAAELLELAAARGYPRVKLRTAVWVAEGADAWTRFVVSASVGDRVTARANLEAGAGAR